MKRKVTLKTMAALFLFAVWSGTPWMAAAQQDRLVINSDGSTFAYPMYSKWIEKYEKADPEVHFTYVPNGSGAGIHDMEASISPAPIGR